MKFFFFKFPVTCHLLSINSVTVSTNPMTTKKKNTYPININNIINIYTYDKIFFNSFD